MASDVETLAKKWALHIVTSSDFLEEPLIRGRAGNPMYDILTEALADAITRIEAEVK